MRHNNLPPVAPPETATTPEWHADGVSRTVVTYGDGSHNVGYRHTQGGGDAANTIDLRREYRGTFGSDALAVSTTPPYRLTGRMIDQKSGVLVERHYYVDPTRGVMLVDRDPKGGTQPMTPVRLRTLPNQLTLGQPLELPDDALGLPASKSGGKPRTLPIASAMIMADGPGEDFNGNPTIDQNRFLDRQLPEGVIPHTDATSHTNPLVDMLPRFEEADAALNAAGM